MTFEESGGWRDAATHQLKGLGIEAISPLCLEGPAYKAMSGSDIQPTNEKELTYSVETSRYIIWKDLETIKRCSAILVNIGSVGWGTSMEIFYASHVLNLPVVAFGNKDERSPWVRHHLVGNYQEMEDAIKFIGEVFHYDYA